MASPRLRRLLALAAVLLAAPLAAAAQGIVSDTVSQVGGPLQSFFGACSGANCSVTLVEYVISRVQLLIGVFATFYIVRNGFTMVYSSQEEEQTKARKGIAAVASGMILMFLAPRLLEAFYTAGGEEGLAGSEGAAAAGASVLTEEILGLLNWAQTLVAVAAVGIIIAAGIRSLAGFGKDENLTNLKSTVFRVASGILVILLCEAVKASLGLSNFAPPGSPSAGIILNRGFQVVSRLLALSTLVGVCVVVYAAIMMIVSAGNEDQFNKSKGLIVRAGFGLVLVLISWMTINFIAQQFS